MKIWIPKDSANPPSINQYSNIFDNELRLPFLFDKEWIFVDNPRDADVIPIVPRTAGDGFDDQLENLKLFFKSNQILLILNLFWIDDYTDNERWFELQKDLYSVIADKILILHTNRYKKDLEIYVDFLWNRQKIFFTNYGSFNPKNLFWTKNTSNKMWQLAEISKSKNSFKFLCPARIYENLDHPRMIFRKRLTDIVKEFSSITSSQDFKILPEEQNDLILRDINSNSSIWYPCANSIYQTTYVSVYIETITVGDCHRSITEKTWDPLIKGNFILPFSYKGIIKDLKEYGFRFPDFIDYSYDLIDDVEDRWTAFLDSLHRLNSIELNQFNEHFRSNESMLYHNRNVFFSRPYEFMYKKIKTAAECLI